MTVLCVTIPKNIIFNNLICDNKKSKMIDLCTCCERCSSRQLYIYPRYSFPKKLLVALSIVVIVAMCIMPSEARPSLEHKKRHRRPDSLAHPTKDTIVKHTGLEHRRRHQNQKRLENLTQANKKTKRPKNSQTDIYYSETKKIVRKLRNTRRTFLEEKKHFNQHELREYKNTPSWLPTVNFVEIHYHDYRSNRSRKNGSTIPERKYAYLMPKLYKSLTEYEKIFNHLLETELDFPDDPFHTYKKKRNQIIQNTIYRLYSTIHEVKDSMAAVNMTIPHFNNKLDISLLKKKVDATECIKIDYLVFRGYGNLLTNWFYEFKCPRGKRNVSEICQTHENKLKQKITSRRKDKDSTLLTRVLSVT